MKVAISIPDDLFEQTEAVVRRLKTSRSEVYARALWSFLFDHAPDRVTEKLNAVLDDIGEDADDAIVTRAASRQVLKRSEW